MIFVHGKGCLKEKKLFNCPSLNTTKGKGIFSAMKERLLSAKIAPFCSIEPVRKVERNNLLLLQECWEAQYRIIQKGGSLRVCAHTHTHKCWRWILDSGPTWGSPPAPAQPLTWDFLHVLYLWPTTPLCIVGTLNVNIKSRNTSLHTAEKPGQCLLCSWHRRGYFGRYVFPQ